MKVIVNGREVDVEVDATVAALLEQLGVAGPYALVERNGEPVSEICTPSSGWKRATRSSSHRPVAGG